MSDLTVHIASFEELDARTSYLLWQLRESVFVVEQSCAYAELDGRDLEPATRHVWLEENAAPIAYLRILDIDGDGVARIGRVLVKEPHRGRRLAETLMRTALDEIGSRPSRLDAQAHLVDWYSRFGYAVIGAQFLEDGIPHVPMSRDDGNPI